MLEIQQNQTKNHTNLKIMDKNYKISKKNGGNGYFAFSPFLHLLLEFHRLLPTQHQVVGQLHLV